MQKEEEWGEEELVEFPSDYVLKMIKGGDLGDNKQAVFNTSRTGRSCPEGLENCRMGQKAGHFYKIKNETQGRER